MSTDKKGLVQENTKNEYMIYMNQGVCIKANSEEEALKKAKVEFLKMLDKEGTDCMDVDEIN
ncbi:hypothetical protein [Bacillus cereus group sp. BfR-BA-01363]|uniref:hypothetical protein n=1 Tax=unclassified Bacillus cereus group TaxID=2750818 RepID=UPI001F578582|nr:hypothetical protein [Bacillus cereus group sp. BfR-BA-01363]MDX5853396.1 hypothetical protein [Bacillus cereus group sp. BfR-BA-01363]